MTLKPRYRHMLAKSSDDPLKPRTREMLLGHLADVVAATGAILQVRPQLSDAFGLELESERFSFRQVLRRAAALHDFGKANSHFQAMVRRKRDGQAFRHEVLSAYLAACVPAFRDWFFAGMDASSRVIATLAVLGHHLKFDANGDALTVDPAKGNSDEQELLMDHASTRDVLSWCAREFGLDPPPAILSILLKPSDNGCMTRFRDWMRDEAAPWCDRASRADLRRLALAKAMLIAADIAGSAVPRTGVNVSAWIKDRLEGSLEPEDLAGLVERRLNGKSARPFQEAVASAGSIAFVRAGCGGGKTVAAYMWAGRHAAGRRLFFCYPTTGTTTEGFRDYAYVSDLPPSATALLHGRSKVDLEDILGVERDENDNRLRIEALASWSALLVVCTVDRVLGLVQNNRTGVYALPALADAAFVFDEIHLYDDRLFAALLRFVSGGPVGLPMLLMTASLPRHRLAALEEAARERGTALEIVNGPKELEDLPRYELLGVAGDPPWDRVAATLADPSRNKVLWVANTVNRAIEFAEEAERRGLAPISYHSRFKYEDRVQRHKSVIEAFRAPGPALAIATQVCEVSLDISADLLVSDLAPIPSLVQRLGRLNRRAVSAPDNPLMPEDGIRPAIFLSVEASRPYDEEEFVLPVSRSWAEELAGRAVSQTDLARAFEAREPDRRARLVGSAWLDGGTFSVPEPLREGESSIPVVMEADEAACIGAAGRPDRDQIVRKTIPMPPPGRGREGWRKGALGYTPVAVEGSIEYSEKFGASWKGRNGA